MKRRKTAPPLELDPRQWMPLAEALQRTRAALGSFELAGRDLHNKLRDGRLQAANWAISYPEDTETFDLVAPARWERYRLSGVSDGTIRLRLRSGTDDDGALDSRGVYIFVRRAELDRLYPRTLDDPATAAGAAAAPAAPRVRRSKDKRRHKGSPIQDAIRSIAAQEFPNGHEAISTKDIISRVGPSLKRRGIRIPERSTWLRALGRRKD